MEKHLFENDANIPEHVSEPRGGLSDLSWSFPALCFCVFANGFLFCSREQNL